MIDKLIVAIEQHLLIRRAILVWMAVLTTMIMKWAVIFAATSPKSGSEIAMILGAVLAPWSTLQGFVFKFYHEARNNSTSDQ